MAVTPADPPALVKMLTTAEYDIPSILNDMSLENLKILNGLVLKHKQNLAKDTSIKAYADVVSDFQAVQDSTIHTIQLKIPFQNYPRRTPF